MISGPAPGPSGGPSMINEVKYGRQKEKKAKPSNDNFELEPKEINDPYILDIVSEAARKNILAADGADDENFAEHIEFISISRNDDKELLNQEKERQQKIIKKRRNKNSLTRHDINGSIHNDIDGSINPFNLNSQGKRERPVRKKIHVMYRRLMNQSLADTVSSRVKTYRDELLANPSSSDITTITNAHLTSPKSSPLKQKKGKVMNQYRNGASTDSTTIGVVIGDKSPSRVQTETAKAHEARMQRLAAGLAQIFLHQQKRKKKLGITTLVGYNGDGKLSRRDNNSNKNESLLSRWNPLESLKYALRVNKSKAIPSPQVNT